MEELQKKQEESMARRRKKRAQREKKVQPAQRLSPAEPSENLEGMIHRLSATHREAESIEHLAAVPSESKSGDFINNLQKEAKLMIRLNHPNIIKIYQIIESETECYIVM